MTNINPGSALELGTALARASWDAALRSSAEASAVLEKVSKLQTETISRLVDETLRMTQAMAGAPPSMTDATPGQWPKMYQENLQRSAQAARALWESALRAQNEMAELGNQVLTASTRALGQGLAEIAAAMEQDHAKKAAKPPQTAEAGVRRQEKAA